MVEINLLPWRKFVAQKQKKQMQKFLFFGLGFVVLILVVMHMALNNIYLKEKKQITHYQRELKKISSKSHDVSVLCQECKEFHLAFEEINTIKNKQIELFAVLNQLAKTTPMEITFFGMTHQAGNLLLFGTTTPSAVLSKLLKIFHGSQLLDIQKQPNSLLLKFQFQVMKDESNSKTA